MAAPTFYIEDHAVDRYTERVRDCPRAEARAYILAGVTTGARLRERTRAGNPLVRLDDCVLVLGDNAGEKRRVSSRPSTS